MQGLRDTGAALSPLSAFLLLQGVETLHLRMERHSQNALAVATHLESHPGVEWVNYPGLKSSKFHPRALKYLPDGQSALVTFGIKGGSSGSAFDAGKKLIDSVKLFSCLLYTSTTVQAMAMCMCRPTVGVCGNSLMR